MRAPTPTTIAAIATGTAGGVGIVRVSGPLAEEIGRRLLSPWPAEVQSHHLYYAALQAPGAEVVDRVLFCLMRAPRSYTGEDVLEVHGHGGAVNLQRLLQSVLLFGAVLAGPGEFTRRAFLNGKLDLTQAEAVAALVGAHSEWAARQAQRHLVGGLGQELAALRRRVVQVLGTVEGTLDFPDAAADEAVQEEAERVLGQAEGQVRTLAESFVRGGRALGQGVEVAVLGCTNAGKSSLVNALCGAERVLVDAAPGTTRDYVEVRTEWEGVPVTIIDTAGERAEASEVERRGLWLGRRRWEQADLLLLVVDGVVGLTDVERRIVEGARSPRLLVWNKIDQAECLPPPEAGEVVRCSALCGWGLDALRRRVLDLLAPGREGDALVVTSARQAAVLLAAGDALSRGLAGLRGGLPWDLVASELRVAAARLGEVTGEEVTGAVLDAIFTRFCIGK